MRGYGMDFRNRRGYGARELPDWSRRGYVRDMSSTPRDRGYDLGYGAGGDALASRRREWSDPSRDLVEGYGDYSARGRYGGYRGAWDTIAMRSRGGYPSYDQVYRRGRGYDRG